MNSTRHRPPPLQTPTYSPSRKPQLASPFEPYHDAPDVVPSGSVRSVSSPYPSTVAQQYMLGNHSPAASPQHLQAAIQQQQAYLAYQNQLLMQQQLLQQQISNSTVLSQNLAHQQSPHQFQQKTHDQHAIRRASSGESLFSAYGYARQSSNFITAAEEEVLQLNPLAASALARRKRQTSPMDTQDVYSPSPEQQFGFRRPSSQQSGSSLRSLRDAPPTLVLSKPGEAYPSGSSNASISSDSAQVETINTASESSFQGSPHRVPQYSADLHGIPSVGEKTKVTPWLQGIQQAEPEMESLSLSSLASPQPRRSFAGDLNAVLGARQRVSSASNTYLPPSPMSSKLSPFATSFQPLPPSPWSASTVGNFPQSPGPDAYTEDYRPRLQSSESSPKRAIAIRQPRGPANEQELGVSNFASRLRKTAILKLVDGQEKRNVVETVVPLSVY